MIVRVVDFDYPFLVIWLFKYLATESGHGPRQVKFPATFESINGMVMDLFCCLTP